VMVVVLFLTKWFVRAALALFRCAIDIF